MIFPGHLKSKDFQNKVGAQGLMKLFECDSEDELRSKLTGKITIQLHSMYTYASKNDKKLLNRT